jgi:uncharacterized DUF497 family protein
VSKKGIEMALDNTASAPKFLFEFDPEKSARCKADPNRAIDFVEAEELWRDTDRLEIPLIKTDEPRVQILGLIAGKHWSAIITQRGENIRIISVRRMRENEKALYEERRENQRS